MLVDDLEALEQVQTIKEQNADNGLYKGCTTLISVTCFSIIKLNLSYY